MKPIDTETPAVPIAAIDTSTGTWTVNSEAFDAYLLFSALVIVPCYFVTRRTGVNPLAALLIAVPFFGFTLFMGVLAFARWKNVAPLKNKSTQEQNA